MFTRKEICVVASGALAMVLLAGCAEPGGRHSGRSNSGEPQARSTRLTGSGITVYSCDGKLSRIDPATGRILASLRYMSIPGKSGLSGDVGGCDDPRFELREHFSSDYSKLATSWSTSSRTAVGYINAIGEKKVIAQKNKDTGFSGKAVGDYGDARFNPRSDELWYRTLPPDDSAIDEKGEIYSHSIVGGSETNRGTCACAGYSVAWPTGWVFPYLNETGGGIDPDYPLVTSDGRVAYMSIDYGPAYGSSGSSGYAYRPWRKGTRYKGAYYNPGSFTNKLLPGDIKININTGSSCDSPDLMMMDSTHALCGGISGTPNNEGSAIGMLTIDRARHSITIRDLLPVTRRSNFDGTISPDRKRIAFLSAEEGDPQVDLYVQKVTQNGRPPQPRKITTLPGIQRASGFPLRILSWD